MPRSTYKAPYSYESINLVKGAFNPSAIHTRNNALFAYYVKYLFQKLYSVFDFSGLPEGWAENYFKQVLLGYGFIAVFDTDEYGVIPQQCSLSDTVSIFYQPKRVLIANPVLPRVSELEIGRDCEVIKMMPDYSSPMDIISYYADLLAIAMETASVNLLNSKVSFVFFADNQRVADTYKELYDQVTAGQPFSVVDKSLLNDDGSHNWDFFVQNVGQNYITDKVMSDIKSIEDQFNTRIGIPNANTQKRERLITTEVSANDIDTKALVYVWLDTMARSIEKVNKKYSLNISVKYRYEAYFEPESEPREVADGQQD